MIDRFDPRLFFSV